MRVVLSWLRELCPTDLPAEEIADALTSVGAEVEEIIRPWQGLSGVVTARVIEVRDHPKSEKLCLARVTDGSRERELVVGVRNMQPDDVVPLAAPGSRVPVLDEPLTEKVIAGVSSQGMLCSPRELGISPEHTGILVLPSDTPLGVDVAAHLGLDDAVLDIAVTPNRPDLMSVLGVAREVAAATGGELRVPPVELDEGDEKAEAVATVEVRDLERCPRYLARVIRGVRVAPSPLAVQARLTASGMRPLSNVVDATNYVMLETGQPLHPFDLSLLAGSGIVVRRAQEGERLVTLDDVERTLSGEDLVIADHEKGVAIAGVMGSASAEVSPQTSDVLLEGAHFERRGILRTARRLNLQTEASMRFERGVDPEAIPVAVDRAAALIATWSGGSVLRGAVDVGEAPPRRRVVIRPERTSAVLGLEVTADDVEDAFSLLRMPSARTDWNVEVEVPGYRVDLEREDDLIEEVARIRGYDLIGSTLPAIRQAGGVPPGWSLRARIRDGFVRAGLREIRSLSFVSEEDLALVGDREAVRMANPLRAEEGFLRTSLLPGLLHALQINERYGVRAAALFETGRIFFPVAGGVEEHERVAFAMRGPSAPPFPGESRDVDFFDAKGVIETLFESLGIPDWQLGEPPSRRLLHPGRSASIEIGGRLAGEGGELHPRVAARLDLPGRVAIGELEVGVLGDRAGAWSGFRPIPQFPPVRRDLAFTIDADVPAGDVRAAIVEAAGELGGSVELFDVFAGDPIPHGKRSLAFSIDFRAPDRTLTNEEADQAVGRIRDRLASDFGAELRAG
ncbi:MAG: phenylalanine--tRNA ligase subunit beta [Actinomycetota bacterium]